MTEISKEYGAALFMLAREEGQEDAFLSATQVVKEALTSEPQFLVLLASPSVSLQERLGVIDTTFGGSVPNHILSFIKLLCEKGRVACLLEAFEEYKALLDASRRVYVARVISALALTEAEQEKLTEKLEKMLKGKVRCEYEIDPSLLGGVIVEMDGKIMDGSLRHRLFEMKEVMHS